MPEPDDADTDAILGTAQTRDYAGARRLRGREEWFWYLLAALSYFAVSLWHKILLSWWIGPLWLVVIVVVGPAMWDRLRGRSRIS